MKNSKDLKKPFFANFLEDQMSDEERKTVKGGIGTTKKAPSDHEDGPDGCVGMTRKAPSDHEDGVGLTKKAPSDHEDCIGVTRKAPSDHEDGTGGYVFA